jgi:hypothetical protein
MTPENVNAARNVKATGSGITHWKIIEKVKTSNPSIRHAGYLLHAPGVMIWSANIAAEIPDDGLTYLIYLYLYIYNQTLSGRNPSKSAVDGFDGFAAGDLRLSHVPNRIRPRGRRRRRCPWQDHSAASVVLTLEVDMPIGCTAAVSAPLADPYPQLAGGRPMPPVLLALDLGQRTGWAVRNGEGAIASGVQEFRPGRFEGGGMIWLRFRAWLQEIDATSGGASASSCSRKSGGMPGRRRATPMAVISRTSPPGPRQTAFRTRACR